MLKFSSSEELMIVSMSIGRGGLRETESDQRENVKVAKRATRWSTGHVPPCSCFMSHASLMWVHLPYNGSDIPLGDLRLRPEDTHPRLDPIPFSWGLVHPRFVLFSCYSLIKHRVHHLSAQNNGSDTSQRRPLTSLEKREPVMTPAPLEWSRWINCDTNLRPVVGIDNSPERIYGCGTPLGYGKDSPAMAWLISSRGRQLDHQTAIPVGVFIPGGYERKIHPSIRTHLKFPWSSSETSKHRS